MSSSHYWFLRFPDILINFIMRQTSRTDAFFGVLELLLVFYWYLYWYTVAYLNRACVNPWQNLKNQIMGKLWMHFGWLVCEWAKKSCWANLVEIFPANNDNMQMRFWSFSRNPLIWLKIDLKVYLFVANATNDNKMNGIFRQIFLHHHSHFSS